MLDNPILQDLRVRQALLYALDRQAISERLFEGRQPVAHTSVNPLDAVHFDDVPKYAFDPDRAVALLEEAGWTELRNGIRHNAAGERLSLEIMTTSGNRIRELVEQVGQSMWRDVGIDVRIRNQPPRVFFGQTLRERTFEGMGMYAWVSAPENIPRTTMHSDMIPTAENNFSGQNYTGFVNAEMDEVLERIQIECGAAVQTELWNRIQTLYAENLPVLPLYFRSSAFVHAEVAEGCDADRAPQPQHPVGRALVGRGVAGTRCRNSPQRHRDTEEAGHRNHMHALIGLLADAVTIHVVPLCLCASVVSCAGGTTLSAGRGAR